MANLVDIENLSKVFEHGFIRKTQTYALRDVSLCLPAGKILGIVGPNGSGKTTLLKILCTLIQPTRGEARICSHSVVREPRKVREVIAYVSNDDRSFFWRLNGLENLQFFGILNDLSRWEVNKRIKDIATTINLEEALEQRFDRLSTGMKRRLAIARALINRPKVLFLDEPFNSLDSESCAILKGILLDQVKNVGASVLFVSHQMPDLKALADEIVVMAQGVLSKSDECRPL